MKGKKEVKGMTKNGGREIYHQAPTRLPKD